jgi:hypothetical protein
MDLKQTSPQAEEAQPHKDQQISNKESAQLLLNRFTLTIKDDEMQRDFTTQRANRFI